MRFREDTPRYLAAKLDPIERRRLFEQAHPEVTIVPPGTLNDPWRAILRPGTILYDPTATTLSSWQLSGLMDQLEDILPPGDGDPAHADH